MQQGGGFPHCPVCSRKIEQRRHRGTLSRKYFCRTCKLNWTWREAISQRAVRRLKKEHDIIVFDDNSDFPPVVKSNVVFHRFEKNYGKKEAWMKFNYIFENVSREYYYYIVLSDDSKLVDNFVERAIETWESINDDMKICLSFSSIERTKQPCFTGVKSIDKGNVILTQWTDLTFICTKQFIKKINIRNCHFFKSNIFCIHFVC